MKYPQTEEIDKQIAKLREERRQIVQIIQANCPHEKITRTSVQEFDKDGNWIFPYKQFWRYRCDACGGEVIIFGNAPAHKFVVDKIKYNWR